MTEAKPHLPEIESAALSDRGLARANNEDALLRMDDECCFAVADGMGGGEAGEVASAKVVAAVRKELVGSQFDSPGERKYLVNQALVSVNEEIVDYAIKKGFAAMGSTVALLIFDSWESSKAYVCHLGDSRVYCCRGGELFQLTNDHNIVTELAKKYKAEDYAIEARMGAALTRFVGSSGTIHPDWSQISVCEDDVYLVCTDGVSSFVESETIAKVLSMDCDAECMTKRLCSEAYTVGAPDNLSLVVVKIGRMRPAFAPSAGERAESDYLLKTIDERNL